MNLNSADQFSFGVRGRGMCDVSSYSDFTRNRVGLKQSTKIMLKAVEMPGHDDDSCNTCKKKTKSKDWILCDYYGITCKKLDDPTFHLYKTNKKIPYFFCYFFYGEGRPSSFFFFFFTHMALSLFFFFFVARICHTVFRLQSSLSHRI